MYSHQKSTISQPENVKVCKNLMASITRYNPWCLNSKVYNFMRKRSAGHVKQECVLPLTQYSYLWRHRYTAASQNTPTGKPPFLISHSSSFPVCPSSLYIRAYAHWECWICMILWSKIYFLNTSWILHGNWRRLQWNSCLWKEWFLWDLTESQP